MAKTLEVKRFKVRYKNEIYGPKTKRGPIIPDVDDATANHLIKTSGGTIIEQPKAKKVPNKAKDIQSQRDDELEDDLDETPEDDDFGDREDDGEETDTSLPPVQNTGKIPSFNMGEK